MLNGAIPFPQETAQRYRAQGYWTGDRLDHVHSRHLSLTPASTALVDDARSVTYSQLEHEILALAAGLHQLGIRHRDRVLLQLPNRISFVVSALALMRIGAIPIYMLPSHRASELISIAAQAEPVAYLGPDYHERFDHRILAHDISKASSSLRYVVIDGEPLPGQVRFSDLMSCGLIDSDQAPAPDIDTEDVAFLQLSGGTTGTPKLIPRSHDDYFYSVRCSAEICNFNSTTIFFVPLPAAHNFPMSSPGFLGTLLSGGSVVLGSSPAPDYAFTRIAEEKVTVVPLVPPLALAWMSAARARRNEDPAWSDLNSVELIQVGGAKLLPGAARRIFSDLGGRLQQVFGMAEGLVCYTRWEDSAEVVETSQGSPMSPADEILIVDEQDRPVPEGTVGHLLTRGPYTIRGYYKAPQHNARSFTADGFYRTGDLVRRLPGGQLVVEGRSKDQINRGGEKISAEEIEDHLLTHPAVFDAAVIAVPDPYLGERSCAVLVLKDLNGQPAPSKRQIQDFTRARGVAQHKIPDRVEFVPAFPSTAVGKTNRAALRRELAAKFTQSPPVS